MSQLTEEQLDKIAREVCIAHNGTGWDTPPKAGMHESSKTGWTKAVRCILDAFEAGVPREGVALTGMRAYSDSLTERDKASEEWESYATHAISLYLLVPRNTEENQ